MSPTALLQPIFVVALLTLVMAVWMSFTRIPAMSTPSESATRGNWIALC